MTHPRRSGSLVNLPLAVTAANDVVISEGMGWVLVESVSRLFWLNIEEGPLLSIGLSDDDIVSSPETGQQAKEWAKRHNTAWPLFALIYGDTP